MAYSTGLLDFLKTVPLLVGISNTSAARLAEMCWVNKAPRGRIIFSQGDPADAFYILRSGLVAEFFGAPSSDMDAFIKERRAGDFFGEMAILLGEPELVTVMALQDSTLVILDRKDFLHLVANEVTVANHLLLAFAERVKRSGEQLVTNLFMEAPVRLAYIILRLEQEEGGQGSVYMTHEYLAHRCGLARQTTSRILGEWRRKGWITTHRGRLEILNRESIQDVLITLSNR